MFIKRAEYEALKSKISYLESSYEAATVHVQQLEREKHELLDKNFNLIVDLRQAKDYKDRYIELNKDLEEAKKMVAALREIIENITEHNTDISVRAHARAIRVASHIKEMCV